MGETIAIGASAEASIAEKEVIVAQDDGAKDESHLSQGIDHREEATGIRLLLIYILLCLCTFIAGLDFKLIATVDRAITTGFDSIQDVGWYDASFLVAM
ncbi:hypothetical protein Daesc_001860 [Daldinia eschscholtzii]|uniref:Major facilitator superfamily (MFS) profile domain-containing protein n=1 Tax=Daldinia eschscholtzii TaxID=292717 RepID=A0AAX6MWN3_9PEZI